VRGDDELRVFRRRECGVVRSRRGRIGEIAYLDTKHFLITRDFLNAPERFFKHLFGRMDSGEEDR